MNATHPTPEQLAAFRLGKLSDAELDEIEQHVAECDSCCGILRDVPDDSFVSLVRYCKNTTPHFDAPHAAVTWAEHDTASDQEFDVPEDLRNHPRYEILEKLGQGGMGVVYKARHRLMDRIVALKVIHPRLLSNRATEERFRRELIGAGRSGHPNIVAALDAERAGNTSFLVMEYFPGVSLARVVEESGPLPVAQACEVIRQAALGLQHAHEQGMVHRDIKPQNLMIARAPDERGELQGSNTVKILDFGLARFVSETADDAIIAVRPLQLAPHLTQASTLMGTPEYIAPEQAQSASAADIRADIYSLGCTLYHLLAGHSPFPEGSALAKIKAHSELAPKSIRDIRRDVPADLARIIDKMLAKDPGQRFQTPAEVAAALAPWSQSSAKTAITPKAAAAAVLQMIGLMCIVLALLAGGAAIVETYRYWTAEFWNGPLHLVEGFLISVGAALFACLLLGHARALQSAPSAAHLPPASRRRRLAWAALSVVVGGGLVYPWAPPVQDFAQTVIRMATNKGELVIEAEDDDIEITIKQPGKHPIVEVVDKQKSRTYELSAIGGEIIAKEKESGLRVKTTEFTLERGGKTTLRAQVLLAEPRKKEDLRKVTQDELVLRGNWKAIELEADGKKLPLDHFPGPSKSVVDKPAKTEMVFVENGKFMAIDLAFFLRGQTGPEGRRDDMAGFIRLHPEANPKRFEFNPFQGHYLFGIYKIEGDMLTVCYYSANWDGEYPTEFKTSPGSRRVLYTFKKVPESAEPTFQPLFNGKNLDGWTSTADSYFVRKDGSLLANPGSDYSMLRTIKSYENFELRLQCKIANEGQAFARNRGGIGLLVDDSNPAQPSAGVHIALMNGRDADIKPSARSEFGESKFNQVRTKRAAAGEWNELRVICRNRMVIIDYNGEERWSCSRTDRGAGKIGLWSVDGEAYFRNIEIKELPSSPPESPFVPLFDSDGLRKWVDNDHQWKWQDGVLSIKQQDKIGGPIYLYDGSPILKDFELKFKAQSSGAADVGILLRSDFRVRFAKKEVDGLFAGISGSIAGGVYDYNSGKLTLHKIAGTKKVKSAWKSDDYNDFLIRCIGKRVQVQINGQSMVNLELPDDKHLDAGQIAFAFLGVAGSVKLRDIEVKRISFDPEPAFTTLFDGKDPTGWDMALATNWRFEDKRFVCRGNGGLLRLRQPIKGEFHLRVELRTFGDRTFLRLGPQVFKTPDQKMPVAHQHVMLCGNGAYAAGTIGMEFEGNNFTGAALKDRTKSGEWFTLEVIHEGRYVRTLINGDPCAELVNTEPAALIGLGLLGFNVEDRNGELQIRKVEIRNLESTPKIDAKRIQGNWTAYQVSRDFRGITTKVGGDKLKEFDLLFDGDEIKSGQFENGTFEIKDKKGIIFQRRGHNKQFERIEGTYNLTHDLLALDFPKFEVTKGKVESLQLALMRFHNEVKPLFNGKNLDGFANDSQAWIWQDGMLIGEQRANDFDQHWLWRPSFGDLKDFELEFDARATGAAQAHILFRGGENPERTGLKINGPMLKIGGATPGGLWSKHRNKMIKAPPADKIKEVKHGDFNHYLVRCVGQRVSIQINGVTMVDDQLDATFIEPVGNLGWVLLGEGKAGTVTFRNIQIRDLTAAKQSPTAAPARRPTDILQWVIDKGGSLTVSEPGKPLALTKSVPLNLTTVVGLNLEKLRNIRDDDLAAIGELPNLKFLVLDDNPITDAGLAHLEKLTNLIALHLSLTKVRGDGLKHLKNMTQLQTLHLERTEVGDAGLRHLRGLPRLGVLQLVNTDITDASLAHLIECPRLVTLVLWDTTIGDDGLKHLAQVKSLRYVDLNRTRVSADGVKALSQALPTCKILSEHGTFGPK